MGTLAGSGRRVARTVGDQQERPWRVYAGDMTATCLKILQNASIQRNANRFQYSCVWRECQIASWKSRKTSLTTRSICLWSPAAWCGMGASRTHFGPAWTVRCWHPATATALAQPPPAGRCRDNLGYPPPEGSAAPAVSCLSHDKMKMFLFALFHSFGEASARKILTEMASF